ncbi:MAG: phosphotransferase family protein [Actinomycetota bacterium]
MTSFTAESLSAYLGSELGADVVVGSLSPVTAGARRINVLFDATIDGESQGFCITQQPNTGEAFDRPILDEVQWLRNAAAAGMRVAEVVAASGDEAVLGGPFFVSRRVDGATIPKRVIKLCETTPGLGAQVAHEIGASLARLHATSVDDVPESVERPPGTAVDAALAWADEKMAELLQRSPALELVLRWLIRNQPEPVPVCPVHGDVRNGNIIVNGDGLGAILDWETAHIGEPFEDLGWLAQRMWRARNDQLEIGGFANRSDLQAGYEAGGGDWDEDRFHWWKVFRTLWWGLGMANQGRQHLDGTFRSIIMAASGRRVAELEWDALCLIEGR